MTVDPHDSQETPDEEANEEPSGSNEPPEETPEEPSSSSVKLRRFILGKPRDLEDRSLFHRLTLIPFLAWVGLGADGLSSSCYGPEEAFRTLGANHTYLAIGLAVAVSATVFIISAAYSRIIESFPFGGGGYVVATKLLGERAGVVSGSALLVDYMLTITTSLAAAGDALFSFLPEMYLHWKLPTEVAFVGILTWLNLRGVRESVLILTPVFVVFLVTHALLVVLGIVLHVPELPATIQTASTQFQGGLTTLGLGGMALLFLHAYSLGGGTFTGIEAVSNGLAIMREPRVQTGKRTMLYMAVSLAALSGGLLLCYLLWKTEFRPGKTMNYLLTESVVAGLPLAKVWLVVTLFSEVAILVVAAQAGFLDGPRVLANMAVDSWVPHRFAALSERLTTQNGILLMGSCALGALIYTGGNVRALVVMYSINVFLTFSLSMFGMARWWWQKPKKTPERRRSTSLFTVGFVLTFTILVVTVGEKFTEGGWITLLVTGLFIGACFLIHRHYKTVRTNLSKLGDLLDVIPAGAAPPPPPLDPEQPTAVLLVGEYSGVGIHTLLNIFRSFPGHFKNLVFLSVGVIDSGGFKGEAELDALRARTEETLEKYVSLANRMGVPATYEMAIGTDVIEEVEALCLDAQRTYPRCAFFAGKLVFAGERWYQRILHNETPFAIQKRLVWSGLTMVVLPVRVR
jgi:amino acid transporter